MVTFFWCRLSCFPLRSCACEPRLRVIVTQRRVARLQLKVMKHKLKSKYPKASSSTKWVKDRMLSYQAGGWDAFKYHDDFFIAADVVTAGLGNKYLFIAYGCPWTKQHAWSAPQVICEKAHIKFSKLPNSKPRFSFILRFETRVSRS